MVAQPLLLSPGHRLGEGSVLADLRAVESGIDEGLLVRAQTLLDWVEEQEMAPFADLTAAQLDTGPDPYGEAECEEFLGRARTGGPLEGPPTGRPVAIAGDGAPMVCDLALVDLAAALGRSVVSATRLVGGVCELAYRLPLIWARIGDREVSLCRGLRVAEKTITLSWTGAAEVDGELVSAIGSCSWAQVDRCVQAAIERHRDQDEPESPGDDGTEAGPVEDERGFEVHLRDAGNSDQLFTHTYSAGIGLIGAEGTLEAADALALEQAIRDLAQQLAQAGSKDPLGARRARALGMLARGEVPLPTPPTTIEGTGPDAGAVATMPDGPPTVGAGSRRHVLLNLHLTDAAILGQERVGRCENTLAPASIDQIKAWCAGATVKVQPILDIADHHPVGTYEIPDRIRTQVTYRDPECIFPHCHTPARSCDQDHIVAFQQGGPTCACNLAPLCRRHHRAKTARRWTYLMIHPGTYYWHAPSGATYLVDAHGTHQLPNLTNQDAAHRYRHPCPSETKATANQQQSAPVRTRGPQPQPSGSPPARRDRPPGTDPPPPF